MIEYEGFDNTDYFFNKAQRDIRQLLTRPTDEELLLIYGLFKQATIGDNYHSKPSPVWFKETRKWEAWNDQRYKPQNTAKQEYITAVEFLIDKYDIC
tara:strand:- start:1638 stop:1928 length:291 start_codon:yes stop_codon:yes gene_type:complete